MEELGDASRGGKSRAGKTEVLRVDRSDQEKT